MPPRTRRANVLGEVRTHGSEPRCMQTSPIFRLPAELVLEILAYFGDPHHNILCVKSDRYTNLEPDLVERLTVIRRLTMTCWHLRNKLFPVLWKYVEGCNFPPLRRPFGLYTVHPLSNGLYPQCSYLLLNPTVGVYVETLSVDLYFKYAPKDLMTKFIDCLIQMPNLRTLEVFSASHISPITKGLKRKSARFPSIRALAISDRTAKFVGNCPNVETVTAPDRLGSDGAAILSSYGGVLKNLKRIVGVAEYCVPLVVQGFPDLQEIGIKDSAGTLYTAPAAANTKFVGQLRPLNRLTVVELDYDTHLFSPDEIDEVGEEICRARRETYLKELKRHLIPVLKDSPSNERKFLRWKFSENHWYRDLPNGITDLVESGMLEVLQETPPAM